MKRYVEVSETLKKVILVDADNSVESCDMASYLCAEQKVKLTAEDSTGLVFKDITPSFTSAD